MEKYECKDCGWSGNILGDRLNEYGEVVECCMNCDSDNIDIANDETSN